MRQPPQPSRVPARRRVGRVVIAMAVSIGLVAVIEPVSAAEPAGPRAWSATLATTPDKVAPGGTVRFELDVTSNADARALVDLEVLDSGGARLFQRFWDQVPFAGGDPLSFSTSWTAPAKTGRFRVVVRVYGPNWAGLLFRDDRAGLVRVSGQLPTTSSSSSTTTTVPATTTTAAPTSTAATTTSTTVPPQNPGAAFVETFDRSLGGRFSVARWRSELSPDGIQHDSGGGGVSVANGRAVVNVGMQNYGDTTVRINQPFDIAGRTGTVTFDTSLYRPSGLWGWSTFAFLADPYSAPSYDDDNSRGPLPREGVTVHFSLNCGAPFVRQYHNYVETDDLAAASADCSQQPATAEGRMNRVTIRVSQSLLQLCATDAGSTGAPRRCWTFNINLGFSRGYLYFGGHNHATQKYGGPSSWPTYWDNISFDGPVIPQAAVSHVADSAGSTFGFALPGAPRSFTLPNVSPGSAARLVLDVGADPITNGNKSVWRLNYRLNRGVTHAEPFVPAPDNGRAGSFMFSIPVNPAELVRGNNTLELWGSGYYGGYEPYVANIDLVVTPGAIPPPTTTTTTSTTTTTTGPTTTRATTTTTTAPTTTRAPTTSSSSTTTTTPPPANGSAFSVDFDVPSDFYGQFDTYVGNYCYFGTTCRWSEGHDGVTEYSGDHSMMCGDPSTQRAIHPDIHNENYWWCAPGGDPTKGHVMVGMSTHSYSIAAFTPKRSFNDVRRVCWDVNLSDLGGGKWFTVTLVPDAVFRSYPNTNPRRLLELEGPYRLDYTIPEFDADNAPGDFNIQRESRWQFKLFHNELKVFDRIGGNTGNFTATTGFVAGDDVATRYRHCLAEGASGTVVMTQQNPTGTQTWNTGLRFPTGDVHVIFADDTYDDIKHGGTVHKTWHVDNILIENG